jgi:electron transfer flavoprotein beta subunit
MQLSATVLVSSGRHPLTGRPRRAPLDARALELALQLAPRKLSVLHAGDPVDPALRAYLGMGVSQLDVITVGPEADPYPPLRAHLETEPPSLVLCGVVASDRNGDGLLPYRLAEDLGWPILPGAKRLYLEGRSAVIEQSLPGARVRSLRAACPVIVSVDAAAPSPRQVAFAKARRGAVKQWRPQADAPARAPAWTVRPAQNRGRALSQVDAEASAAERLRAITEIPTRRGEVVIEPNPEAAAQRILEYLTRERLIPEDEPADEKERQS